MEMGYCALAKLTATLDRGDELDARYMSIVKHYPDEDTVRAYPEILGIAWKAVMDGGIDFLGSVAGELELLDSDKGQFFTPFTLSRMMAEMTLADMDSVIEQKGYISLQEPAAGAGGMVLAYADALAGK